MIVKQKTITFLQDQHLGFKASLIQKTQEKEKS